MRRLSDRVVAELKAAIPGATTANVGVSGLSPLDLAFLDGVAAVGAYDRFKVDTLRLPPNPARILYGFDLSLSSGSVNEGGGKPIDLMTFSSTNMTLQKVVG